MFCVEFCWLSPRRTLSPSLSSLFLSVALLNLVLKDLSEDISWLLEFFVAWISSGLDFPPPIEDSSALTSYFSMKLFRSCFGGFWLAWNFWSLIGVRRRSSLSVYSVVGFWVCFERTLWLVWGEIFPLVSLSFTLRSILLVLFFVPWGPVKISLFSIFTSISLTLVSRSMFKLNFFCLKLCPICGSEFCSSF